MTIDESRQYLIQSFGPEFSDYINNKLAGDFAAALAEILVGRQTKKPSKFNLDDLEIPTAVNSVKWCEWIAVRKAIGKQVTLIAAKQQVKFLATYSEEIQRQIIDSSIMNGYTGLFPPKGNGNGQTGSSGGSNQRPDNSAVGRVRANAERERAKIARARPGIDNPLVGINDRDVRPQVDESIRGRDRSEQCMGGILEGDYARDG